MGSVAYVEPILEYLLEKEVITYEHYVDLSMFTASEYTSNEGTMRTLYREHLKDNRSKEVFYRALEIHEKDLILNM